VVGCREIIACRLIAQEKKENSQMPTITNLVFQGGSVKGIAYLGALEVLERETVYIDHLNISTLAFNLSKKQQEDLIKSGQDATQNYFGQNMLPLEHFEEASSYEEFAQNI
jgi:hypothetical protein